MDLSKLSKAMRFSILFISSVVAMGPLSMAQAASKKSGVCQSTGTNCYKESFSIPIESQKPLDILFVVDTSSSMVDEMVKVRSAVSQLVGSLPSNADVNMAVMLAHGSTSAYSGTLFKASSEPATLKSRLLNPIQMEVFLRHKLSSLPQDADAGGGEEGMFSLFNGITSPSLLAASQAEDFFRPNAGLTVVFIADQRDICAVTPAGASPETDPGKLAARIRDCEGLTAMGLSSRLRNLKGAQALTVTGIIYSQSPPASIDGNETGYGYTDMIAINQSTAIDFDHSDIANSLRKLLVGKAASRTEFALTHSGIEASTVRVIVDGVEVAFKLSGSTVILQQPAQAGSKVVIHYCLEADELSSKAKKLAAIMAMSCPIYNKSYPRDYVAPTAAEVKSHLRACTPVLYPETPTTAPQQRTLDHLLNTQDPTLQVKMFKRLWYTPEFSDHFELYFGIEVKEAVQVFCLNNSYLPEMLVTSEYAKNLYDNYETWKANPVLQKNWNFAQSIRKQLLSCVNK